jgi:hypothetical protein
MLFSHRGLDSCSYYAGPDSSFHMTAVAPSPELLEYVRIAKNQLTCLSTFKAETFSSLRIVHINMQGHQLLCDMSKIQPPLIPEVDKRRVFLAFHKLSPPGTRATRTLMSAPVIWRGMSLDIAAWCRDCQQCVRGKVSPQPAAPIQPIPATDRKFTHVHVDTVSPLPTSAEGFSYLFTMVDRSTRWLEAVPIQSISAQQCVDTFISTWVARYGVPATITSDQGRQFTSAPIIRRAMAWLREAMSKLRLLSGQSWPAQSGQITFPGSSLA